MKILVVDDDSISRKLLGRVLEKMGYQIIVATNGREAWEICESQKIQFVISDWEMPEMDGVALCKMIREKSRGVYCYFIVVTVRADISYLKTAFEAGVDDFISKPYNVEELGMRVKTGERIVNLETEHTRLANILTESRNKLKTVVDSLTEEIVLLDERYVVTSANRSFVERRRRGFKEVIGFSAFEIDNALFCDESRKAIDGVFISGKAINLVLKIKTERQGILEKEIHCLPVSEGTGKIKQVVFSARDITEERIKSEEIAQLNNELNRALEQIQSKNTMLEDALRQIKENQAQMLQSEKMVSIGQLAAGVAHEINNPTGYVSSNLKTLGNYMEKLLGIIDSYRNFIDSIGEGTVIDHSGFKTASGQIAGIMDQENDIDIDYLREDIPALIRESREGMDRIGKIVADLKDFAHPEDKEMFANINECIESTLNIVWNEIKYKAGLEKHYGDLPPVLCYPRQLNQVFMNLLINAAQAIDERGIIKIRTQLADEKIRVIIADTGHGIPAENISKIFDPFFTTKPVGKGTGLGLHIVYNIIKKHGGDIHVESIPGKGTSFLIEVPVRVSNEKE